MGVCWHCFWGWHPQVQVIYDEANAIVGESAMNFGPAHVVWEDENFDDENIRWCIAQCDNPPPYLSDFAPEELRVVRASLEKLLATPNEWRGPMVEDDYEEQEDDDDHPERFPPTWLSADEVARRMEACQ